jgi:ribonuclease P protein component
MSEANVSTEQPPAGQAARIPPSHVDAGRSGHHQGASPQESAPPLGLIWRVSKRETFASLHRARRHRAGPLTVSWVSGDPVEPPRVAYAISRRVGPAVVRNRVRRRLRALTREAAPLLRPGAYLISVEPEATLLSSEKLRTLLVKVLKQVEAS